MILESILTKNKYQGYIAITLITLVLIILPMLIGNKGMLYGSEGDWYQQHVAIAEALRQTILDSKTLFPQYIGLGGGSNIYDFAYYGLYRIDLLLSCLFPSVGMKYIVAGYAALGVVVSGNLCFYWLKTQRILDKYAFVGAFLLVSSTCFYQAHHQIMFVNYMPFLILALIGTDRMKSTGKIGMLIISLFLIYIHSFFYSISCLCVWLIYYIYQSRSQSKAQTIKEIKKVIIALTVSMGLAAILLIPAGLDILSTTKDGGRFSNEPMKSIDFTLEGLLFSPYGCGMSIFALYLLLTSLTSKKKRILAVLVLICFLIPTIALVLNGFLYPRAKVLIPFVLLVVLLCADTLQEFCENRKSFPLWPLGVCLLTAIPLSGKVIELKTGYNDVHVVIAVSVAIAMEIALIFLWGSMQKGIKVKEKITGRCIWIVLLAPLLVNLAVNTNEMYLKAGNLGENVFSDKEITAFAKDGQYRFEMLYDKMNNCNVLAGNTITRTTMYSSVTNRQYADFYYETMKNPIRIQNRVALLPDENRFFTYFMGVKYIETTKDQVPYGYKIVKEKGAYVLAENSKVLPMAYGKYSWISERDYEKLEFPETVEALCTETVIDEASAKSFVSQIKEENSSNMAELMDLATKLENKLLIIDFPVKSRSGKEINISINKTKNRLSSKYAPYPNGNNDFTFVIPIGKPLDKLEVDQSKGDYEIGSMKIHTMDMEKLQQKDIVIPKVSTGTNSNGKKVFDGTIAMEQSGYFVTSYPYAKGYAALVDGVKQKIEKVNTCFIGFPLEAGQHKIEITFNAPGYKIAMSISIVSLILLIFLILRERKKIK